MEQSDAAALPGFLVGQNLPELTTELLSAHTTQSSELLQKEDLLQRLQVELESLQEQLQVVNRDVCNTVRGIFLKEDLLAALSGDCEELECQVSTLVQEKEAVGMSLRTVEKEKAFEREIRVRYEDKMELHRMRTKDLEQLSSTQIELEALRTKLSSLKAKRTTYCTEGLEQVLSGEKQRCLQDQIAALEASRGALSQDNSILDHQIEGNKEDIEFLKKDIETGKKKQAAQLRRLQRLVSEALARKRQWTKKADQLRVNIRQIKQRNKSSK